MGGAIGGAMGGGGERGVASMSAEDEALMLDVIEMS
jgi:hypothetical protein